MKVTEKIKKEYKNDYVHFVPPNSCVTCDYIPGRTRVYQTVAPSSTYQDLL